jgi:hypothetical protein
MSTSSSRGRINSRSKGKRGELEFAEVLRREGGFKSARRGRQFQGTPDSPDVACDELAGWHIEVKRVEAGTGTVYRWLEKATADAGVDHLPVVAHRRNGRDWIAILPMGAFLDLLRTSKSSEIAAAEKAKGVA